MPITNGGVKAKRFDWAFHDDCVKIKKENGKQEDYPLAEIFAILRWLTGRFGADYFPLANNVEKLWHDEEADGLGVAILRQQPKRIPHAQGSSYLGVILEHVGILEWNNRHQGIKWRIIHQPLTLDELREAMDTITA